jgi:hypothetical protein
VVVGDVFSGSRGDEDVDEVQSGIGSLGAWSASSITSRRERERRLEMRRAEVRFGHRGCARSAAGMREQRT